MGFSANAIMAKSRALYGKRLKKDDYSALVNSKSINELVSYLKSETAYAQAFERANSQMSSFQVEELLKINTLSDIEKISRYEFSTGNQFYRYFIIKNDIQQILRFLHFLVIEKPEEYLSVLPPFFNKRSELDLYKLAAARTFDEMLEALKGTGYDTVLKPYNLVYQDPQAYIKIECSLNKKLWTAERDVVKKFKGKQRREIEEILTYQNDMENLVRIYRLKRLADADKLTISNYLNLYFTHFTEKDIEAMLEKSTAREMLQQATDSYYKKYFKNSVFTTLEDFTQRVVYQKLHREMRYSTNPIVVMICYFFLKENEVSNVIHITEGIRNKMAPEAIKTVLVGTDSD